MSRLRAVLFALFTALVLVSACGKATVESETKAWNSNVSKVKELMAQYPGLKPALEARMAEAEEINKKADSLSGDEAVAKLKDANAKLRGGWVTDLENLDTDLADLRKKSVEAASGAGDAASQAAAKLAADDAKKTIERVEKTLAKGAKTDADAAAVVKKVKADVATSLEAINKVVEGDKKKKDDKAKADQDKADKAAADKAAADAKVADWTCEYCDAKNKHDKTKCDSCGAARSEKKKK